MKNDLRNDLRSLQRSADRTPRGVRHAVFPVGGLGADFLPATKACPKEMLPIVDRPLIQYAVEEAAAAGVSHMIFITGRGKRSIEDHFDRAYELEHQLAMRADDTALDELRSAIPAGVAFSYIRQREPAGLLDALCKARPLLGAESFAVLLPDQLFDAGRPALAQLLDVFAEQHASVVGALPVEPRAMNAACLVGADLGTSSVPSARTLVIAPPIGSECTALAPAGRFVFTPGLWDAIDRAALGGEHPPSLVRAIRGLMEAERVFACVIDGTRFDCGTKLGFLEAQFAFAQKHHELWSGLRRRLDVLLTRPSPPRDRAEHPLGTVAGRAALADSSPADVA